MVKLLASTPRRESARDDRPRLRSSEHRGRFARTSTCALLAQREERTSTCPQCRGVCFGGRQCQRCKLDDWICGKCDDHNFGYRLLCRKCGAPKKPTEANSEADLCEIDAELEAPEEDREELAWQSEADLHELHQQDLDFERLGPPTKKKARLQEQLSEWQVKKQEALREFWKSSNNVTKLQRAMDIHLLQLPLASALRPPPAPGKPHNVPTPPPAPRQSIKVPAPPPR